MEDSEYELSTHPARPTGRGDEHFRLLPIGIVRGKLVDCLVAGHFVVLGGHHCLVGLARVLDGSRNLFWQLRVDDRLDRRMKDGERNASRIVPGACVNIECEGR